MLGTLKPLLAFQGHQGGNACLREECNVDRGIAGAAGKHNPCAPSTSKRKVGNHILMRKRRAAGLDGLRRERTFKNGANRRNSVGRTLRYLGRSKSHRHHERRKCSRWLHVFYFWLT